VLRRADSRRSCRFRRSLRIVAPDAHAVPALHAERDQRTSRAIGFVAELAVRVADLLMARVVAHVETAVGSGTPASVTRRSEYNIVIGSSRRDAKGCLVGSRTQKPEDATGTCTDDNGAGTRSLVVTPRSMVPAPTSPRMSRSVTRLENEKDWAHMVKN
jgi:hypothetical protein